MKKSKLQVIGDVRSRISFWGIYNNCEQTEKLVSEANVLMRG